MIRLKEARKRAIELRATFSGDLREKVQAPPKMTTLLDWIHFGYLTGTQEMVDGGSKGRWGLYADTLPAQILTICALKQSYNLNEIGPALKNLLPLISDPEAPPVAGDGGEVNPDFLEEWAGVRSLDELAEKMTDAGARIEGGDAFANLMEDLENRVRQTNIQTKYLRILAELQARYRTQEDERAL